MAQKRGLKKEEAAAEATPATPKTGGKRGPRKVSYAIDLGAHKDAIDRLAALYGKDEVTVVADLTMLYMKNSLSPHFAKLQSGYAQERREQEAVALREITPLFAPVVGEGVYSADGGETVSFLLDRGEPSAVTAPEESE